MDAYAFWRDGLEGRPHPMHDGALQCGYYRTRPGKKRASEPVAIFEDAGELVVLRNGYFIADEAERGETWTWCCAQPVTYEVYTEAVETGRWPEDPPEIERPAGIGHNQPDTPLEQILAELQGEEETAAPFLAAPITTQEQADKVAVWSKRLTDLRARIDEHHKVEKAPHLEAGRKVDRAWFPLRDRADVLVKRLKGHLTPYLNAQREAERERARKAAEEAMRLQEEAARAAAAGEASEEIAAQAAEAEAAAKVRNIGAGRTGAKASLRTKRSARIVDAEKALLFHKDHPDLRAELQRICDRCARAQAQVPGVEIIETQEAA